MTPLEKVLSSLPDAKPSGNGYVACCPAHNDKKPSLSVTEGDDGRVLIHCHAGCSFEQIVEAAGLVPSDLYPVNVNGNMAKRPVNKNSVDK